jgi:farnesyl-diphosphate farnesyltransferase
MSQPSLNDLLKQTSRSFYLTLRVLPRAIRPPIGLAYLLARTTDTIADTEIVPVAQRLEALQRLRERILGSSSAALNFGELARQQGLPAERMLLERVEEALAELRSLVEGDLKLVRNVLDTITSGQELDLRRFGETPALTPAGSPKERERRLNVPANSATSVSTSIQLSQKIIALQNDAELDDYTYRVAGCVGEFWTQMCVTHLFPAAARAEARFLADGIRFGKGLQLVNILRDLPKDLRTGRCYLPADQLAGAGLTPADLLSPANEAKFRPLYGRYLDLAESHLAAGWDYTNAIPGGQVRVRLACAWPILIGLETLRRLRREPVLDPARRVKISRAEVRCLIIQSVWRYPFRNTWRALATFSH